MLTKTIELTKEERANFDEYLKKIGVTRYDDSRTIPEPWVKVDATQFFEWLQTYSPQYTEFRSVKRFTDDYPYTTSMHIYWFYKNGYAVHFDYRTRELLTWKLGCDHKMKEITQKEAKSQGLSHWGMHCHVYKCTVCGFVESFDSSG